MTDIDSLLEDEGQRRARLARSVKHAADVVLPPLDGWNDRPCPRHDEARADCEFRSCGGSLFSYQRVGVAWLYLNGSGILADQTGLGKSLVTIGLVSLLKSKGELGRALIVCQSPAVDQWAGEFARFAPSIRTISANQSKGPRHRNYTTDFDVCIIGYQMMLSDKAILKKVGFDVVFTDDVDPLRNDNQTHRLAKSLAAKADRVVVMNATPLQVHWEEMYRQALLVGGRETFGTLTQFRAQYVRSKLVEYYNPHAGRMVSRTETVGYRNGPDYREKMQRFYLRRTYADVADIVDIPDVAPPETVWLDLHPAQRRKYVELQDGVLRLQREVGESVKRVEALAKLTHGAQICSGLTSLGEDDGPQASVKMDWLAGKVTEDWLDTKVVVFTRFRGTARTIKARLEALGVGVAKITGDENHKQRKADITRFWQDPNCRVVVGTSSIERSLNLQNASVVVNFDTLLNPARMNQILGRARRVGSKQSRVYVINLFCRNTQEDKYLGVLRERQALADYLFEEESDVYEALSPTELLSLIR